MKIKTFWLAALIALFSAFAVFAESKTKEQLAQLAVSADSAVSAEAVKNLRALGKEGLDALFAKYADEIARFSQTGEGGDEWKRIASALDSVAMQKDAYAANLFWFTDLEEAKREAQKTKRPILSLRLLGNLNEEFSCANSRFFRALLYSNTEISKYLRENYVLHWKSVRPAPRVTIDFGDGRKIERTITGNSIHYILDKDGAILDAIPGLYAPSYFLKYLTKGREINNTTDNLPDAQRETAFVNYRKQMFDEILNNRRRLIEFSQVKLTEPIDRTDALPDEKPAALEIAPRAVTKMSTERVILTGISDNFSRYAPQINLDDWKKLSKYYAASTKIDDAGVRFIKRQNKQTGLSDAQFSSLLSNLADYVALDTTRNDFLFHTKLYEWLNQQRAKPLDLGSFNSRVYAELFKTPDSDKWLGLYNADVYTALDGNGIVK
jgi:hypothetical protein